MNTFSAISSHLDEDSIRWRLLRYLLWSTVEGRDVKFTENEYDVVYLMGSQQ